MKTFISFLSNTAEFFFPNGCILCGASLLGNSAPLQPLCNACAASILEQQIRSERCRICGAVLTSEDSICMRCREKTYAFDAHISPYMYSGDIPALLSAYKNGGYRSIARFFAYLSSIHLSEQFAGLPLVPVPSRPMTRHKRGFDNTGLICRHLNRLYGIRVLYILARSNGKPQKSLDYNERFSNLEGKISLKHTPDPLPPRVVLFDDVFTSGATADACAAVLKNAGIQRVDVLTIAQD